VVSNADLLLTFEKLLGPAIVGDEVISRVRAMRPTTPCFLTHIGLRGVDEQDLERACGYHWRTWDPDRVVHGEAFKIFVPTMYEPRMAPPGGQIVVLQRVMEIDYEGIDDWAAHKDAVQCDLLDRFEAVLPGVREHIVSAQSASALTAWRFTLNRWGAMLGWEMSPGQLGSNRPAIEGPVRNLHLTGHWTRPGGGITPVIVSAVDAAAAITGRPD
jgi:prolycopene isomerase